MNSLSNRTVNLNLSLINSAYRTFDFKTISSKRLPTVQSLIFCKQHVKWKRKTSFLQILLRNFFSRKNCFNCHRYAHHFVQGDNSTCYSDQVPASLCVSNPIVSNTWEVARINQLLSQSDIRGLRAAGENTFSALESRNLSQKWQEFNFRSGKAVCSSGDIGMIKSWKKTKERENCWKFRENNSRLLVQECFLWSWLHKTERKRLIPQCDLFASTFMHFSLSVWFECCTLGVPLLQ